MLHHAILRISVSFITSVCIYDIYCTVKYANTLYDRELNPIAKMLIEETDDIRRFKLIDEEAHICFFGSKVVGFTYPVVYTEVDVSKLILIKVVGLVAALEIFNWLIYSRRKKIAVVIIGVLFIIQSFLLYFLLT
jgi:hypothetical protein